MGRNGNKNLYLGESEATDDPEQEVDSPFYPTAPHHVRFSPSAKSQESQGSHSPFGRKTRRSRRGLSSYIQSLPSEDEQSEFNRHYRSDLRRRQQRRASEEDTKDSQESGEKKSTRSQ